MRNYKYLSTCESTNGRKMDGLSLTIPDETMSIRTIMERHAKGLPIVGEKIPIYDDDESSTGINPKTLDLVDLQELAMENKNNVDYLNDVIKQSKAKQKKTDFIENPLNTDSSNI